MAQDQNTALILVDLQNDFCPLGALPVPEGDLVIPIANAANHPWRKPGQTIDLNGLPQILWPIHCVQGSFGAEFVPELKQEGITKVFEKGTDPGIDSYSGFFDNGHRKATGLGDWLKEQGITRVYVLGLATDYCVKFTALDALQLGFETYLVEDASRGVNLAPGDVDQAVADMRAAGVEIVQSDSLLQAQ